MRFVDFRCPECGRIYRDVLESEYECVDCWPPRPCERMPAAPAFKVNGFNAANRYSKEH